MASPGFLVDTGPLRRHRDFRRLWAGQLVSQAGSQLTIVAVSYQVYQLTGSTAMVGLVSLGQLVPLLAGSLVGGPLVDAWDRRRVMLVTQLMLAAGSAGLVADSLLHHPLLWPVFVCTAWAAAFQGIDWSARRASLRRLVPPADLPAALSLQSAAFQVTSVVGPAGRAADRARWLRAGLRAGRGVVRGGFLVGADAPRAAARGRRPARRPWRRSSAGSPTCGPARRWPGCS